MRILLTGGAGFIGSCLIWKLNSEGITDIVVVDELGSDEKWKNLIGKSVSDYIEKDRLLKLFEEGSLKKSFDCIIHFGACSSTSETDASFLINNNYLYSQTLAKFALKQKVEFIYASSAATYGAGEFGYKDVDDVSVKLMPMNIYGYSKQLFDLWVIRNKLSKKFVGFKFFNVFGPNEYHKKDMMSVIAKVFDRVKKGQAMRLFKSYRPDYGNGEQKRDFIYVKDALDMVYYFIEHPDKKGIFNIGTGKTCSWNDVANALFFALGLKPKIEYIDMPEGIREKYQYFTQADISKLRKAGCKHNCMSLEDSVKDYAGYLKGQTYL
jgi:ADP-L-glycero-D-manno-heptose 6-epimerase